MSVERITSDPAVMGGVPCVQGTRIPVATIAGMYRGGTTIADIVKEYPQLNKGDVQAALDGRS